MQPCILLYLLEVLGCMDPLLRSQSERVLRGSPTSYSTTRNRVEKQSLHGVRRGPRQSSHAEGGELCK